MSSPRQTEVERRVTIAVSAFCLIAVAALVAPGFAARRALQKQRVTMVNTRTLANAAEAYMFEHDKYPSRAQLPVMTDGWGAPLRYELVHPTSYAIVSGGSDGLLERETEELLRSPIVLYPSTYVRRDDDAADPMKARALVRGGSDHAGRDVVWMNGEFILPPNPALALDRKQRLRELRNEIAMLQQTKVAWTQKLEQKLGSHAAMEKANEKHRALTERLREGEVDVASVLRMLARQGELQQFHSRGRDYRYTLRSDSGRVARGTGHLPAGRVGDECAISIFAIY